MRQRWACVVVGAWLALGVGCAEEGGGGDDGTQDAGTPLPTCVPRAKAEPLVDNTAWVMSSSQEDPFDDRPAEPTCGEGGSKVESGILEVNTGLCGYFTAHQPTLREVQPCETIEAVIAYYPLFAAERAEAHVALAVDDEVVWEGRVPIPSPSGYLTARWVPGRVVPAGSKVSFHLHNHGTNDWRFLYLSVGGEDPPP
jgi:hypothetical protein